MKSLVIMMACWILATGCSGGSPDVEILIEEVVRLMQIATDGERGGAGGSVRVLYKESRVDPEGEAFSTAFSSAGGLGGEAGGHLAGPEAVRGEDGPAGEFESVQEVDFLFDASGISAHMVIDVGDTTDLYLQDNADPLPALRLETFRVQTGSEMEIGCDVRIQARHFVIEEGGRLTIRNRDGMNCSIGIGRSLHSVAGLDGPLAFIQAERLQLDGILDLSGNPGEPGQDGGHGGRLLLRAEHIELGSRAQVLLEGGAGGAGSDEQELTANGA